MTPSRRVALCVIRDDAVFQRVSRAALAAGLSPGRADSHDERALTDQRNAVLMIYDLEGVEAQAASNIVRSWLRLHPSLPVLLYHRPGVVNAGLVGHLSNLARVSARMQVPGLVGEEHELATLLRELILCGPELVVRAAMGAVRRTLPPAINAFLEALLDRLGGGGVGAPEVGTVATRAGLKAWEICRACHRASVPKPERLIEWLTIMYVVALADLEGLSVAKAAAQAGTSPRHIRKLRASLLPEVLRLTGRTAGAVLPDVIRLFAVECGIDRDDVEKVIEQISA